MVTVKASNLWIKGHTEVTLMLFLKYSLSCCWSTAQYSVAFAKLFSEKSKWHKFFSEKEMEVNNQWCKHTDHLAWKVEAEDCKKAGFLIISSFYCQ